MAKEILVVDDSAVIRRYLVKLLTDAGYVVDFAKNGQEAVEKVRQKYYALIILDIEMPVLNGIDALKIIMRENSTRILIISALLEENAEIALQALELGAIDYISKPKSSIDIPKISKEILEKVKKVLSILPKNIYQKTYMPSEKILHIDKDIDMKFVLVGASTGGPRLIESICKNLPKNYPHSVCIVQHMPNEFTKNFAQRLNTLSKVEVLEAENNLELQPSRVIIAKGGKHLHFRKKLSNYFVMLAPNIQNRFFTPSVDEMFFSAVDILPCKNILAVELTGIGDDGADGMVELRKKGAYTLAENEESAVVYGMPKEALKRGGVVKSLPYKKILDEIIRYGQ